MAKGRERFEKRQRAQAKQEKAAEKRARRAERAQEKADDDPEAVEGPSEDELLEQVRLLNEAHAEERISTEDFEEKRAELFEALGLGLE